MLARARAYVSESLFRNSISLALNIGITAGCAYGALALITRFYSVQAVGLSAAAVSASSLIVSLTQFGTDYSLPRFLPENKNRASLINVLHTGIILCTAAASVVFLVLPAARQMYSLGGWLFAPIFIIITCLQAAITFLGVVLVSDRASSKLARANGIPNVIKLVAPPAFIVLGNLGALLARTVSSVFAYIALIFVLTRRGHRFRLTLRISEVREIGRFSMGMYVASTVGGLPQMLLPIIVLSRLGPAEAAYWSIAYTAAMLLAKLPSAITRALLPEISSRPAERRLLMRKAVLLITVLVLPSLAIAYVAAPVALAVFGKQYASASLTPLRWLIAAGLITALNYVTGAILFLAKKSTVITVVNVVNLVVVLGLAVTWARDPTQVAISWFVGDIANTALFALFAYSALRKVGYRFEGLGGEKELQVSPVAASPIASNASMPTSLQEAFDVLSGIAARQRALESTGATGQLGRAFDMLSAIAEHQRETAIQDPSQYDRMTEPRGLYSVLMLQEAERIRRSRGGGPD